VDWSQRLASVGGVVSRKQAPTDPQAPGRRADAGGQSGADQDALVGSTGDGFDLEEHLNNIHKSYLRRAMTEARGVKAHAARLLGIKNYQTLDAQLKRLDIHGDWDSGK